KARELDSDSLDVRYEEVNLLADQNKTDEAIKALKGILDDMVKKSYSASEKENRLMLLERLAMLYRSASKYQDAVDTYQQMAQMDTEAGKTAGAKISSAIAETWLQAKDNKKALAEANDALKKYPDEPIAKLTHASVLAESGKVDEAVAEL